MEEEEALREARSPFAKTLPLSSSLPPSPPFFDIVSRFLLIARGRRKKGGEERNLAREITWLLANLASSGGEERVS